MNLSKEFRIYAHYWKPPRFVKFNELICYGANNSLQEIFDNFDTKAYTFQRFTGLLDKNGVKVFEGDILIYPNKQTSFETICKEIYWDGAFYTKYKSAFYESFPSPLNKEDGSFVICGNIFENPSLKC